MKRVIFLATILLVAGCSVALAQEAFDLSARGVESARPHHKPYHNMSEAVNGGTSRYVAVIEEPTRSESGSVTTYTTHFALPVYWLNRQIILRIGYASTAYTVYVNGREVGFTPTGVMGCEFNITKASAEGRNEISIKLDKSLLANKIYAPKESVLEGIEIFAQPTMRIRDIITRTALNDAGDGVAEFVIPVKCNSLNRKDMRMRYTLRLGDSLVVADGHREISLDMRREDTLYFTCIVPAKGLWSTKSPNMLRLDLENRIDNRIVECVSIPVGVRQIEHRNGKLYINREEVTPNLAEWEAVKSIDEARKYGYNGVIVTLDKDADKVIAECNKQGFYVVVRTPIDTTLLGDNIRRGGNPSNDPLWNENYLWRNLHALNTTKRDCSVIGYIIAKGHTSGVNIYDSYLMMKSLVPNYLVMYNGAKGEWATDK